MAKITNIIGQLSGKAGGNIFAFNKAGAYMRVFRSPTNPKTAAQSVARNNFTAAVTSWHNLTDEIKQLWNIYASSDFKAKYPVPGMLYSGFNAFVSLKNELLATVTGTPGTIDANFTKTYGTFDLITNSPPAQALSSMIKIKGLGPFNSDIPTNLTPRAASMSLAGKTFGVTFVTDQQYTVTDHPIFEDAIGNRPVGIITMASMPKGQKIGFTKNPKYSILGILPPPIITAATAPGNEIEVLGTWRDNGKKFSWSVGEVVTLTNFLISDQGATQPIGSIDVIVEA